MESNLSETFCDDTNQSKTFLNSTAFNQDPDQSNRENEKKEWILSPIVSDENRLPIFKNRHIHPSSKGSTSLKESFKSTTLNLIDSSSFQKTDDVSSGYESKSTVDDECSKSIEGSSSSAFATPPSKISSISLHSNLSSFLANKSLNAFDSRIIHSLHKSVNFSPRVVFGPQVNKTNKSDEKFQWSVEQLAILKPAHISEDEIAASHHSPDPQVDEAIQDILTVYWKNNPSYIPSPDGPRYVHLPHRDGSTTTIKYGPEGAVTQVQDGVQEVTPPLADLIRKKEAMKTSYATSSPKHRPKRTVRKMKNCRSQTDLTIPPNSDLDLKKVLGEEYVYDESKDEEKETEEVFDISTCSIGRKLFFSPEEEDLDLSMASCDNANVSQRFNDSLSPVRRDETQNITELDEEAEMNVSVATKSHVSQIAINVSILNDCMMHSISQEDDEEEEQNKENDQENGADHLVFHNDHMRHIDENEFEALDESTTSNSTPRHEDLDWTPRRNAGVFKNGGTPHFRKFNFEFSPIHPGKLKTPKSNNPKK